jgi:hypothetical protein
MRNTAKTKLKDFTELRDTIIDQIMFLDLYKSLNTSIMNDFSQYRRFCSTLDMETPKAEYDSWFMIRQLFQLSKWVFEKMNNLAERNEQVVTATYKLTSHICSQIDEDKSGSDQLLRVCLFAMCCFDNMASKATEKQNGNLLMKLQRIFEREKKKRNIDENSGLNQFRLDLHQFEGTKSTQLGVKLYVEKCAPGTYSFLKEQGVCTIL